MANKKLPITLDEHSFLKLKTLSKQSNISMAAIIRQLISKAATE